MRPLNFVILQFALFINNGTEDISPRSPFPVCWRPNIAVIDAVDDQALKIKITAGHYDVVKG